MESGDSQVRAAANHGAAATHHPAAGIADDRGDDTADGNDTDNGATAGIVAQYLGTADNSGRVLAANQLCTPPVKANQAEYIL